MTRAQTVQKLLPKFAPPERERGEAWAPSNIALCKYWGKRNDELNLPINSSLSVSLGHLGTGTVVSRAEKTDAVILNGERLTGDAQFAKRLTAYLDLFRPSPDFFFQVQTENNFPTAAGLASSASGYAALTLALDDFFGWRLERQKLSILARLGSGSAARSVYTGFVEWRRGEREDGLDSVAEPLPEKWPELRLAVATVSTGAKPVGSTEGMKRTVETSALYKSWPEKAARDLELIRRAIQARDFPLLGETAESNALAMHATMIDTRPSVLYWLPETIEAFRTVWTLRQAGVAAYFTIDAGPNVKILFLEHELPAIQAAFPQAELIIPFSN